MMIRDRRLDLIVASKSNSMYIGTSCSLHVGLSLDAFKSDTVSEPI
jgi:hypothetical protein